MNPRSLAALVLVAATSAATADPPRRAKPARKHCSDAVADTIRFADLQLVGVVRDHERTRFVFALGDHPRFYTVGPGQCIGRERVPFGELAGPRDWGNDGPPSRSPLRRSG